VIRRWVGSRAGGSVCPGCRETRTLSKERLRWAGAVGLRLKGCETGSVSQLPFDEGTGRQLEALYRIGDAVRRRRLVRAALAAAPSERILDVGCGPGFYCAELLEEIAPDGSVVGLDSSAPMLALAARRCEGHRNVEFHEADATSLPVKDASFDAALCVQVLEYVPDSRAGLAELCRAVRPGGRVVVWDVDWATVSWHSADPARMTRVLEAWDQHLAHPSLPRTLAPGMRSVGFEHIVLQAHSFAAAGLDPDSYGAALVPMIESFVPGRNGVSKDEAKAWAAEQRELGQRGEFYFACLQFCFTARRPS
jgi:arsenite methyltransferase